MSFAYAVLILLLSYIVDLLLTLLFMTKFKIIVEICDNNADDISIIIIAAFFV